MSLQTHIGRDLTRNVEQCLSFAVWSTKMQTCLLEYNKMYQSAEIVGCIHKETGGQFNYRCLLFYHKKKHKYANIVIFNIFTRIYTSHSINY